MPCNRCRDSNLSCTHSIVRKKRGPRKGRGAVLDNLRSRSLIPESSTSVSPHGSTHGLVDVNGPGDAPTYSTHTPSASITGTNVEQVGTSPGQRSHSIASQHQSHAIGPKQQSHVTSAPENLPLQNVPMAMDDFQSFDEFAQNVLADSSYFSYEPTTGLHEQSSLLSGTPAFPIATPVGSGGAAYETPQTTFATTIALDDSSESTYAYRGDHSSN